ncbi:MAG: sulfate reduction electron transfer complex DsrMKJOP subunit DsrJ [Candidatus Sumerlaeota bacterium]|nr:sulfate reduction electron transfer complex DsrMKJOP subunit DsrJ [Candidatus Sumerlaeota bacterium]
MHDGGKIMGGLAVFFALLLFPVWNNLAQGKADYRPNPQILPKGNCVESREYMLSSHMDLLNTWRDQVVRQDKRIYVSTLDGKEHLMSLSKTCLGCHTNKAEFCDQCHTYMNVAPYCWDCHVDPQANK